MTDQFRKTISNPTKALKLIMMAIALHSYLVGLGLLVQIPEVMTFIGFGGCANHFFPAQGGVFHIVLAIGYSLAAKNPFKYQCLIIFTMIIKASATIFLLTYFFFFETIWIVLISGLIDALMFLAVKWAYQKHQNKERLSV